VTSLTNGTSYDFQVLAVNVAGTGAASNMLSTTPTSPATVPGAPRNLAATPQNGQVYLTWLEPSSNGGAAITDYVVEYRYQYCTHWHIDGCQTWTWSAYVPFADGGSTNLFATVGGLDNGTLYGFHVAAVNSVGTGPWSVAQSTTPTCSGCPGIPTLLHSNDNHRTSIELDWSAPVTPPQITSYEVRYCVSDWTGVCLTEYSWTVVTSTNGTSSDFEVTGLSRDTWYTFQVRARNSTGAGGWSTLFVTETNN
jgi:hypothetical protein